MGEIKSTIDLIMERTKNLTMTDEEKRQLRQKELTEKVRGCMVRYLDGMMDLDNVKEEMLQEDVGTLGVVLKQVIRDYLDPEEDQERLYRFLTAFLHLDEAVVSEALKVYQDEKKHWLERRAEAMRIHLEESGIRGSAVIVNPGKDPDISFAERKLKEAYRDRIVSSIGHDKS